MHCGGNFSVVSTSDHRVWTFGSNKHGLLLQSHDNIPVPLVPQPVVNRNKKRQHNWKADKRAFKFQQKLQEELIQNFRLLPSESQLLRGMRVYPGGEQMFFMNHQHRVFSCGENDQSAAGIGFC